MAKVRKSKPTGKPRTFKKLEVVPSTFEKFKAIEEAKGLSQIEAGTRIFEWFMSQPDTVQSAIFGQVPRELKATALEMLLDGVITPLVRDSQDESVRRELQTILEKRHPVAVKRPEPPPSSTR